MKTQKFYKDHDKFIKYRARSKQRYRERTGSDPDKFRKGADLTRLYSLEEDELILAHDITDRELAEQLGRSVGSIQNRRWKLRTKMQGNSES